MPKGKNITMKNFIPISLVLSLAGVLVFIATTFGIRYADGMAFGLIISPILFLLASIVSFFAIKQQHRLLKTQTKDNLKIAIFAFVLGILLLLANIVFGIALINGIRNFN